MKKIWFLLFLFPCLLFAQDKPQPANDLLTAAYKKASEENKNVFVIFHASWCGWCKKLDSCINSPKCKNIFQDNYVIVHLTVHENKENKELENPGADEILKHHNAFDQGIPFWLIYDKTGVLLADSFMETSDGKQSNIGCPSDNKEVIEFIKILQATSAISLEDMGIIATVFINAGKN